MEINIDSKPETSSYYASMVGEQKVALLPSLMLESGHQLRSVPIAYKTWGILNENHDNVIILCHALTGSSDAEDWWRDLMGPGKVFDSRRFFIFCGNLLGSPYGSASPLTINPDTGRIYGPDFPATTFRDDIKAQKTILDALGISQVASVIGGSMGGMLTLEWPLCTPPGYVKDIIPIATSAYHSAWGISWGEAQRECIYADSRYQNGWYNPVPSGQPRKGMGAARMVAMLTYRSHISFEARFGRRPASQRKRPITPKERPNGYYGIQTPPSSDDGVSEEPACKCQSNRDRPESETITKTSEPANKKMPATYAAQTYMQYQAEKFLTRFDANCYIHLTTKMDSHNVATRERLSYHTVVDERTPSNEELRHVFREVPPGALVISVETDVLFCSDQQKQLAQCLPEAMFVNLDSTDGHDGFLLEFDALGDLIADHLQREFPLLYEDGLAQIETGKEAQTRHDSVFGEAESDQPLE